MTSSQWDLEVLATELRRHSGDLSLYAGFLLTTLSSALPAEMVEVERKGSLLGRLRGAEAPVVAVTVRFGDQGFTLRRDAVGKPGGGDRPARVRRASRCAPRPSGWTSGPAAWPPPWGRTRSATRPPPRRCAASPCRAAP